ncbi:unnamed protein product [Phytophthora lilii]|uniref:Unnamed protein product n=1 Tax=Phytophthora lilii TaxID=2077276 RepID=A0A9W6TZ75_9STRA|nr:unnamed protein product [Phytophthora lilii]
MATKETLHPRNSVLGRADDTTRNPIEDVLEGLINEDSFPAAATVCRWINPSTGRTTKFPLQHALDYAYFVDGGRTPVPDSVGQSFCQPPARRARDDCRLVSDEVLELFDPFIDDDGQEMPEPESHCKDNPNPVRTKRSRDIEPPADDPHQPSQKFRRVTYQTKDASIVKLLRDDPDLLDRFLAIRQGNDSPRHPARVDREGSSPHSRPEPAARNIEPPSNTLSLRDRISSVCTRAYDIRFGSKGLSIRHFARISQDERIAWLEAGGSNFDNLSASAEFTKAPPATCLEDVIDATRVFLVYTREYDCEQLVTLTEDIVKFLDETLKRVAWTAAELPYVVLWVNDVLEDFREAINPGLTSTK